MDSNSIKLAELNDIPEGSSIIVQGPEGISIALFNLKSEVFALENVCPHMGGPLGEGEIEDDFVTCPWHGWEFNIKDGFCKNMPGEDAKKLPIFVHEGSVYLKQ